MSLKMGNTDCTSLPDSKEELKTPDIITKKSKSGVAYTLHEDGSLTFYPTTNIKLGTKCKPHVLFTASSNCPKSYEAVFDPKQKVVRSTSDQCGLLQCAELAYSEHYPLLIKPEHIFLLILQAIAVHVDKNAEKLRSKYVHHDSGKKQLHLSRDEFVRGSPDNDWQGVVSEFIQQIDKNTKKDVVPLFDSNFTSSTLNEKIAAKITLMSTCKNYFEYSMSTILCGFPAITLGGTLQDWELLRDKVQTLLKGKVDNKFGKQWSVSLIPILDRFIAAFKGDISMVFWNSMVYRGQWSYMEDTGGGYGFGEYVKKYKSFISGWINVFFPFIGGSNRYNRWCYVPYEGDDKADAQYKRSQQKELDEPLGPEPDAFPEGVASAPVKWNYLGKDINLEFTAGFIGYQQDEKTLQLKPTVGWYIKEKEKDDQNDMHW
eukprot:196832_1